MPACAGLEDARARPRVAGVDAEHEALRARRSRCASASSRSPATWRTATGPKVSSWAIAAAPDRRRRAAPASSQAPCASAPAIRAAGDETRARAARALDHRQRRCVALLRRDQRPDVGRRIRPARRRGGPRSRRPTSASKRGADATAPRRSGESRCSAGRRSRRPRAPAPAPRRSRSASARTIAALLPPSSAWSGFMASAQSAATTRPVVERSRDRDRRDARLAAERARPPRLAAARRSRARREGPRARGSRRSRARSADACGAGFSTTPFPKASAGAIFPTGIASGLFHGVTRPTTPTGRARRATPGATIDRAPMRAPARPRRARAPTARPTSSSAKRRGFADLADQEVDEARPLAPRAPRPSARAARPRRAGSAPAQARCARRAARAASATSSARRRAGPRARTRDVRQGSRCTKRARASPSRGAPAIQRHRQPGSPSPDPQAPCHRARPTTSSALAKRGRALREPGARQLAVQRLGRADGVVDDADLVAALVGVEHRRAHAGVQVEAGERRVGGSRARAARRRAAGRRRRCSSCLRHDAARPRAGASGAGRRAPRRARHALADPRRLPVRHAIGAVGSRHRVHVHDREAAARASRAGARRRARRARRGRAASPGRSRKSFCRSTSSSARLRRARSRGSRGSRALASSCAMRSASSRVPTTRLAGAGHVRGAQPGGEHALDRRSIRSAAVREPEALAQHHGERQDLRHRVRAVGPGEVVRRAVPGLVDRAPRRARSWRSTTCRASRAARSPSRRARRRRGSARPRRRSCADSATSWKPALSTSSTSSDDPGARPRRPAACSRQSALTSGTPPLFTTTVSRPRRCARQRGGDRR